MNKLKVFWSSLPHQAQAAILFGASAMVEALGHSVEEGKWPSTLPEVKHLLVSAVTTGAAAAWVFYRKPNLPTPAPETPKP